MAASRGNGLVRQGLLKVGGVMVSALLGGCVLVHQVGASVGEHELYRTSRVAPTLEERLGAAHAYVAAYPDGAWAPEVRAWLGPAHEAYLRVHQDDLSALRGYLAIVPPGTPEAQAVATRIAELEVAVAYVERREAALLASAAKTECELEAAKQQRERVVSEFMRFVGHVSAIRSWGERTVELEHEFLYRWRIKPPAARCELGRCTKTVALTYTIPELRAQAPRVALFDVSLDLVRGGVVRATIGGPELFSRLAEALEVAPVPPGDAMARLDAIATSLIIVENALEAALPARECSRAPVSPVIVLRECRGVRAQMIAASDPTEEDRVVVEPLPPR